MKQILFITLLLLTEILHGQTQSIFQKGQFQVHLAFSLMPVQRKSAEVKFYYIDGSPTSSYLLDTISAEYNTKKNYFGNSICIGIGYFLNNNIRTSINLKPHLNSFLSNKGKNAKVYGAQFDLGIDYFVAITDDINISFGTTASRILGGFGITSGGAKNKEYLVVNNNELYDDDIGFHIIDNSWAFAPRLGLNYRVSNNIVIFANSGFQMTFARSSRMNFAGFLKDGNVKWNAKSYDDADLNLTIDNTKIGLNNINDLPFKYSGLFFDFGTVFKFN